METKFLIIGPARAGSTSLQGVLQTGTVKPCIGEPFRWNPGAPSPGGGVMAQKFTETINTEKLSRTWKSTISFNTKLQCTEYLNAIYSSYTGIKHVVSSPDNGINSHILKYAY